MNTDGLEIRPTARVPAAGIDMMPRLTRKACSLLTSRGWWFILFLLLLSGLGAAFSGTIGDTLVVIALTLLAWFLWEWAQFAYRFYFIVPRLRLHRELRDERKAVPILWAGASSMSMWKYVLPVGDFPLRRPCRLGSAGWQADRRLGRSRRPSLRPAARDYFLSLEMPCSGRTAVRRRSRSHRGSPGLLLPPHDDRGRSEVPCPAPAHRRRRQTPRRKRHNIFPPPGVHRLKRPGGGSELLDLRDYMPGDPPKMIAWKASARKDKLFTKEFESEVPSAARCLWMLPNRLGSAVSVRSSPA